MVTAADANEVARIVMNQIHGLPGVKTTLTCLGVETG